MTKFVKKTFPSMMEIFNMYSTNTLSSYECSGCGKKSNSLLFFSNQGIETTCFCSGCIQRMTKENKELLFTKYNKLTRTKKACNICNAQTHNILHLGKFNKKYLCHRCWNFNFK